MNRYDAVATVGWVLLVLGWWFRRDRRRHLSFVVPGMTLDLALVLWLEFTRSVIEQTVGAVDPGEQHVYSGVEKVHIASSIGAVALYIPTIVLGILLIRGGAGPAVRTWHKRVAVPALVLRTVGFGCMWFVETRV